MEDQKPKSITTIGIILIVISSLIIFSNGMGALVSIMIGFSEYNNTNDTINQSPISFLFSHYLEMCLIMVTLGLLYLVGGIYLRKYKMWANRLVTVISALIILSIMGFMVASIIEFNAKIYSFFFAIIGTLICTIPFGLLIRFLNKKAIKQHFD